MDNSAVQSRGSISSISTSNQIVDGNGSGNGNLPSEFVNHGKSLAHLLSLFDNPGIYDINITLVLVIIYLNVNTSDIKKINMYRLVEVEDTKKHTLDLPPHYFSLWLRWW